MKKVMVMIVFIIAGACGGILQETITETQAHGDMLSKCRAKARVAYYYQDAGFDGAWEQYEACKDAGVDQ